MNNSQLFPAIWLLGSLSLFVPSLASAQEALPTRLLSELERPSTSAADLLAQQSATVVQVTSVRLNPTASGIEVILETADGATLEAKTTTEGKTFVAEIPNAVLALQNRQSFSADNPAVGITRVTVTQLEGNRLQIQATGETAVPVVAVRAEKRPVASVPVQPPAQDEVEIVVTGDRETPYRAPNSGTATGTDTPIIETPFSIQVVPQEVLREQQVTRLEDSLRNVSGVAIQGSNFSRTPNFSLRGFENAPTLRDGFRRYGSFQASPEIANIEQIEVLKGPASILYGEIQPGGVVNLVSKQPLSTPFYEAELQVGSRGLIRPRFDISGPLTADGSVLYRLNGLYQTAESFRDFDQEDRRFFIAPALTWKISNRTTLGLSLEYFDNNRPADGGVPVIGREVANVPRDRVANAPSDAINSQFLNVGYNLEHRFSENWKVRNAFRFSSYDYDYNLIALQLSFDEATATQNNFYASQEGQNENYSLQTNIVGKFATGAIAHTLLFGVDLNRSQERIFSIGDFLTSLPLNIFNPIYGQPPKLSEDTYPPFGGNNITTNRLGVYIQDQISFNNFKLLAGIRYDTVDQENINLPGQFTSSGEATQNDDAFTPRLGLIYQPIPSVSLYASYSRSFTPNSATTSAGEVLQPEQGEGYELGIKTEFLDGRLFATLAYFDLTKQNVAVTDPNFPLFSVASGEQRSRGVELDVSGEILPGWKIIASYTYTNAEITKDTNSKLIGNRLFGVPEHSASLWTTYEIQRGDLQGLGFGIGFNYVGERTGDLQNSYEVGSYLIANAAVFYQRNNWRFGLNLKNIGNVNYIESVSNSRSSGNFFGEPFTVIGSVSVRF